MQRVLELGLGLDQRFLGLAQGLQKLVSLVQHIHHQLLEISLGIRAVLRATLGAQGVPFVYGRHHLAHHLATALQKPKCAETGEAFSSPMSVRNNLSKLRDTRRVALGYLVVENSPACYRFKTSV